MSTKRRIEVAIFDMDGLLTDSEPLWDQAEVEVTESLGVGTHRRDELPDLLGLRIDPAVDPWYVRQPWRDVDRAEAIAHIIRQAIELAEASRLLLPDIREAMALCKARSLKMSPASVSPLVMLEKVLNTFEPRDQSNTLASAEYLPQNKPHPQIYLDCATTLGADPQHCVALEDSVNGMTVSKAARMRVIVVPEVENGRDLHFVLADVKLPSLRALTTEALLVWGRWRVTRLLSRRRQ